MTYGTEPNYWRYETTGVLQPAIDAFLAGSMTPTQISVMRAYLRQWVDASVWDRNPHNTPVDRARLAEMRQRVDGLTNFAAIEDFIADLTDDWMDPL
jgi:hypothetical protein